jgi:hypothetical protein
MSALGVGRARHIGMTWLLFLLTMGRMVSASNPAVESNEPFGELSARDAEILAFERQWWKFPGAKEQAIRDKFQMSATRYYQVLNALIDKPEAVAQDPLLVKRLRRLRSTRQRNRSAKRLGIDLTIDS